MNLNQLRGILSLSRRRPQLISLAAQNLTHQLVHKVGKQRRSGWSAPPEQITIMVTDWCNLSCKMCHYANNGDPNYQLNRLGKMPKDLFCKLMDEVPGHPVVSFTGGEPLLHPKIADLVSYARRRGCLCTLTTNGWVLERRARELCEAGLDLLVVSVDGPKETHDRIRSPNSFERLATGLEAVLAQPKRPLVFVNMSISDLNFDQIVNVYRLALKWRVDGINFNHLWMQTDGMIEASDNGSRTFEPDQVQWELRPEQIDTGLVADSFDILRRNSRFAPVVVNQLPDLSREQIATWYQKPEQFVKYGRTRCAWVRLKVWPDGGVRPCRAWQVGNIAQTHTMDVWNNEKLRAFRRQLASQGVLPICSRCCYLPYQ